jgi:parallel beta-helix repeat protein
MNVSPSAIRQFQTATPSRPASRLRLAGAAAAIGLACGSIGVAFVAAEAGAADIVHVSPFGDDSASGSADSPVRTIEQGVRLAESGDTVQIAGGTYHESVQVYAKEVHLVAAPGADVVLDGARVVDGWSASPGGWSAPWSTDFERVGAPYTTSDVPEAGWPEQFFLDGAPLAEETSLAELDPGEFFYDKSLGSVVIAENPNGRLVEGSDLSWGLYLNKADGSTVDGLTVRRYATQNRHMAAVRAYADDLSITDTTVELNARIGLSAMGDRIDLVDVRALDNGHLGVHGHRSTDLTMTDLQVIGNNREHFDAKHSAGGIKVTETARLVVESTVSSDNNGPGIWTDLAVTDSRVVSSTAERNSRSGIEIELSQDIVVFDNTLVDNGEAGIWVLESSGVDVWHNTALHNVRDIWVLDGDRADLTGVVVKNNVLGGGADGAQALFNADDWTERRSAADMDVQIASNRYWLHPDSPTKLMSRWANWPQPLSLSAAIDDHRAATGQGDGSDLVVSSSNPFARSSSDIRQADDAPAASPLPAAVADAVGLTGAHPAGALSTLDHTATPRSNPDTTRNDDQSTVGDEPDSAGDGRTTSGTTPSTDDPASTPRTVPAPGSTPEGAENAEIARSSQTDIATPSTLPAAPVVDTAAPVQPTVVGSADDAVTAEAAGLRSADDAAAVDDTRLARSGGWGAIHDHVLDALADLAA